MAKPSTKRGAKSTAKSSNANETTPPKPPSEIPLPYTTPPSILRPLLDELDPTHVYITHIDTHPWAFKRRIFTVPVIMNIVIALLLLWRAYVAIPSYITILMATLGYENVAKVDIAATQMGDLIEIGLRRAFMFSLDYALAVYLLPWPIDFFLGSPASPMSWRWSVGFQDQEVVVRKSRKWDKELEKDWLEHNNTDSAIYTEVIIPAIDREWVAKKTGYLMMDKHWDLDFAAMTTAHALLSSGQATLADFQKTVLVHSEPRESWLAWQVYKVDEGGQEEGRRKIVEFKDKLTRMGKENLFFKWIELIQYESGRPGGGGRGEIMGKAKELFEEQGVDFEKFWEEIGGVGGMPGLESTEG